MYQNVEGPRNEEEAYINAWLLKQWLIKGAADCCEFELGYYSLTVENCSRRRTGRIVEPLNKLDHLQPLPAPRH